MPSRSHPRCSVRWACPASEKPATDFVHIQLGTPTEPHVLIVDDTTTPDQLEHGAQIAEGYGRATTARLLRQVATARA